MAANTIFSAAGHGAYCQFRATNLPCQQMLIGGPCPRLRLPRVHTYLYMYRQMGTKKSQGMEDNLLSQPAARNNKQHNSQTVGQGCLVLVWFLQILMLKGNFRGLIMIIESNTLHINECVPANCVDELEVPAKHMNLELWASSAYSSLVLGAFLSNKPLRHDP